MKNKKYENRLGIAGWLGGGRWGVERYLYILHRLTGLGLLGYFLLHIFSKNPIFKFGEFMVFAAFAFHALNGIRLILIELGLAVGQAEEPIFPYKSSINNQRPLMVAAMVLAGIFIAFGAVNAFFLGH